MEKTFFILETKVAHPENETQQGENMYPIDLPLQPHTPKKAKKGCERDDVVDRAILLYIKTLLHYLQFLTGTLKLIDKSRTHTHVLASDRHF